MMFTPTHKWDTVLRLSPGNREKIILDNKMCPFCLRHEADQEYYSKNTYKKLHAINQIVERSI
jgi:hypothetical protein